MNLHYLTTWLPLALDAVVVGLLGLVFLRLGRDPVAPWREREQRLREIFDGLRNLVAQAEGISRDLDRDLAARERRLRELLAAFEAAANPALLGDDRTENARRLAASGTPAEDIARRLGMAVAEVRLLIGLEKVRTSRHERRAHTVEGRA